MPWKSEGPEKAYIFKFGGIIKTIIEAVPGGVIRAGKQTYLDDTRAGWWIGVDTDGLAKINIGTGALHLKWSGTALEIAGDGSGLTAIDGGNITTGTVTADKLSVSDLAAINANIGAANIDKSLTINVAAGTIIGKVATVEQWRLDQYGIEIQVSADPQALIFANASHQEIGRLGVVSVGNDTYLALDVEPLTASASSQSQLSAEAQDASANMLFAKLALNAPYNTDPNLQVSIMQVANAIAEILFTANTFATPAANRGLALVARSETSTTTSAEIGRLQFRWTNVAHAAREPEATLKLTDHAGTNDIFTANPQTLDLPSVNFSLGTDWVKLFQDGHATFVQGNVVIDTDSTIKAAGYKVGVNQVVGAQQAAISALSVTGTAEDATARTAVNSILAVLRAHGLIAT